jgi:L-amino acid N-acyltransferase YncA
LAQADGDFLIFVAERGGRVVGVASGGRSQEPGAADGIGQLHAIYLAAEVVGTGCGAGLLERVVDSLRERGYRSAFLWVFEQNARACAFYERHGWRRDGGVKLARYATAELPVVRLARALGGAEL